MSAISVLRSRLTLEAPVDVPDDTGGTSRSYLATGSFWGQISPAQGTDRFIGERMEESITHAIRLRFQPGLTAAMRLRLGARVFLIHGVEDIDEHHRFVLCQCEEIKP